MPQLIAGNWKMHCLAAEAVALARDVAAGALGVSAELLVCPTALHVAAVAQALKGSAVAVGGQDCHQSKQGAHTGDIAAPMLRDVGASWVILGHSERRRDHGETDELVREKTLAAVAAGLTPIVCVGENADQRAGGQETEVVGWQLAGSLPKPFSGVVAYEPVWAIGSGKTATEEDVAHHACVHPGGTGAAVRRGRAGDPDFVWRVGQGGQCGGAAGGAACRRRAGRRGQPERGGISGDCPRRSSRVRGARGGVRSPPLMSFGKSRALSTVLLIIHLFVTLALIGVVLIQRSEGGGLGIGSSQGMGSFMSGRGTANLLTRTTAILAAIFMLLSLTLALLNRSGSGPTRSILDTPAPVSVPASTPAPGAAPGVGAKPGAGVAPTPATGAKPNATPAAPAAPPGPSAPTN